MVGGAHLTEKLQEANICCVCASLMCLLFNISKGMYVSSAWGYSSGLLVHFVFLEVKNTFGGAGFMEILIRGSSGGKNTTGSPTEARAPPVVHNLLQNFLQNFRLAHLSMPRLASAGP